MPDHVPQYFGGRSDTNLSFELKIFGPGLPLVAVTPSCAPAAAHSETSSIYDIPADTQFPEEIAWNVTPLRAILYELYLG
jgi:hypothetical protein